MSEGLSFEEIQNEGALAFASGQSEKDCPYTGMRAIAWSTGWAREFYAQCDRDARRLEHWLEYDCEDAIFDKQFARAIAKFITTRGGYDRTQETDFSLGVVSFKLPAPISLYKSEKKAEVSE